MAEHLLNAKETAEYLGITERELKKLVRIRVIPAYKIGGIYLRFKKSQLDQAAARLRRPAEAKPQQIEEMEQARFENIKDFFYFNDFYIVSSIFVILILVAIFTS